MKALQESHQSEVLLVRMPFDYLYKPSLQLSLLKAGLERNGISAAVMYENLRFAKRIGAVLYCLIANEDPRRLSLVGEWLFSEALFSEKHGDANGYIKMLSSNYPENFVSAVSNAKQEVSSYLDECVDRIIQRSPRIVAFATLSDQIARQTVASLALMKRLNGKYPDVVTVIGGPNWDQLMAEEAMHQFSFLNAVIAGEMDEAFPQWAISFLNSEKTINLPGVYIRNSELPTINHALPVRNLDALPTPCYDDYFDQLKASSLDHYDPPRIVFETSRGCWWGEKSQCTFCGLNGTSISYRSKSPERALSEILSLAKKYPEVSISAADWILNMKYFNNFVIELSQLDPKLDLFYEVKSNLSKEQLRMLRDAGVESIQPGIESFSNQILTHIKKGSTGLKNIQMLKWCKEFGIQASWLLLFGFPGEPHEEYSKMAEWIPLISHLEPPAYCGPFHLDRFSPYFEQPAQFGIRNVKPWPAYQYIFPFEEQSIVNLAAFFTYDSEKLDYAARFAEEVHKWEDASQKSNLISTARGDSLLIWDFRKAEQSKLVILCGLSKLLYEVCDSVHTLKEVVKKIARSEMQEKSQMSWVRLLILD